RRAMDELERATKRVRDGLLGGMGPDARGTSQAGPGASPGNGRGNLPNKGGSSTRQSRILRWKLIFTTQSGRDYVQQLQSLGAILAYADSDLRDPKKFHVL